MNVQQTWQHLMLQQRSYDTAQSEQQGQQYF
jgi:hypothetical protein